MANLFGRIAWLQISLDGPRDRSERHQLDRGDRAPGFFTVKRTLKPDANSASVEVFNLECHEPRRDQAEGVRVILEAGYADVGLETVITGDCYWRATSNQGPSG